MRRPPTCLATLGLIAISLALPSFASATPVITFKAKAVAIPGFKGTGNIKGAGAAVQAEYTISGTEYGGFPPPIEGINFFLPKGSVLHPSGFPTCPLATLEPTGPGPKACPKASRAGPVGVVHGQVAFGTKIVPETATLESFYAPGGGLEFFTFGHEPTILEIISKGHYINSSGLYGKNLVAEVPLVETVPGAQDASITAISVKVGSAIKKGGKTIYYGRLPKTCPKGGYPLKTEVKFAGLGGLAPQTVSKTYNAKCPSH
jgi:hypothetical protein